MWVYLPCISVLTGNFDWRADFRVAMTTTRLHARLSRLTTQRRATCVVTAVVTQLVTRWVDSTQHRAWLSHIASRWSQMVRRRNHPTYERRRSQEFVSSQHSWDLFLSLPSPPSLPSLFLPFSTPFTPNPSKGPVEHCKLPSAARSGLRPGRRRIFTHFDLLKRIPW